MAERARQTIRMHRAVLDHAERRLDGGAPIVEVWKILGKPVVIDIEYAPNE